MDLGMGRHKVPVGRRWTLSSQDSEHRGPTLAEDSKEALRGFWWRKTG